MGLRGHRALVIAICLSANFLGGLSGGVLGMVVPVLAREFDTTIEVAMWVTIGPMFATAMFAPILGKLADILGRTRMWWTSFAIVVVSAFLCGVAPSMAALIGARVVGGLAGAGVGPTGFGIMCRDASPQQRGVIVAMQTATGTLGGSMGIALGGM